MIKIAIIGGGAAGLMAAYSASLSKNAEVHLFEKNDKIGRKLAITGKGRCNITNTSSYEEFMENIPHNSSFMHSAFSQFNNFDTIAFFNENGLETKEERGGRVFPLSDKALDVVDFFLLLMRKMDVKLHFGTCLTSVKKEGKFRLAFQNRETMVFDRVVIATGGLSYPKTGSTGDGYRFAAELGHTVTKLYPSLVALNTEEGFVKRLAGLSLRNIGVTVKDSRGKAVYKDFGELLFTHTGVSGPVILSASSRITKQLEKEKFTLLIDLKPALDEKKLDARLLKDFESNRNKDMLNALAGLMPKSLIPAVIEKAGIEPEMKVCDLSKAKRRRLLETMKAFGLTITGTDGYEHAVITYGGVTASEINPKTMQSKLVEGLYFAGELIDVDAYTGGFNLQIAFTTGYAAGKHASL